MQGSKRCQIPGFGTLMRDTPRLGGKADKPSTLKYDRILSLSTHLGIYISHMLHVTVHADIFQTCGWLNPGLFGPTDCHTSCPTLKYLTPLAR
jgi:hypothetical protein